MAMPREYLLTLNGEELGRFDTRDNAEREIARYRDECIYPPDLEDFSISSRDKIMSSFRLKRKEETTCLKCQHKFMSPDKTRIRICQPCKTGRQPRYDMKPVKESPNDKP
jgi:hypothetical protein